MDVMAGVPAIIFDYEEWWLEDKQQLVEDAGINPLEKAGYWVQDSSMSVEWYWLIFFWLMFLRKKKSNFIFKSIVVSAFQAKQFDWLIDGLGAISSGV